jgi:hypothetical protein
MLFNAHSFTELEMLLLNYIRIFLCHKPCGKILDPPLPPSSRATAPSRLPRLRPLP